MLIVCYWYLLHQPRLDVSHRHDNLQTRLTGVQDVPHVDLVESNDQPHLTVLDDDRPGVRAQGVVTKYDITL